MNGKTNASGSGGSTGISIPLEAPTNLALSAEDSKISLTWTDPNDKYTETYNELVSQWSYDSLVRKQGSAPTSINDGTLIAKITGKNQYQNIPYVDTGMENDKEWFYSVFAHNQFNTPSDPIYGSDIPTATVVTEYVRNLQIYTSDYASGAAASQRSPQALHVSNDTHEINLLRSTNDAYYEFYCTVDKNFIINKTPMSENSLSYSSGMAGIRLGNSCIFINPEASKSDDYNYHFSFDQNLVINKTILSSLYDIPTAQCSLTSVNNQIVFCWISNNLWQIDTNLISSLLSSTMNKQSIHGDIHLDTDQYGIMRTNTTSQIICFDRNSEYQYIELDNISETICSTSRCVNHMILYGYQDVCAISNELVQSSIEGVYTSSDSGTVNAYGSNCPSVGCGFIFKFGSGMTYDSYTGCNIIDKNLMVRDGNNVLPSKSVSSIINKAYVKIKNANRIGSYIFIEIVSRDEDTIQQRWRYQNYAMIIKNGYESNVEGG